MLNFIISLEEGVVLIGCAGGSLTGADKKNVYAGVAEWQTQQTQNLPGVTSCGFKVSSAHSAFVGRFGGKKIHCIFFLIRLTPSPACRGLEDRGFLIIEYAGVAEWQTQQTQNLPGVTSCGFKSHLLHFIRLTPSPAVEELFVKRYI